MTLSTLIDLVKIQITSTGTGILTLGAAVAGYRGVEALQDGNLYSYSIQQNGNYEVGQGVYLASGHQFVRTPQVSSSGNATIDLSGGAVLVFTARAADFAVPGKDADSTAVIAAAVAAAQAIVNAQVFTVTSASGQTVTSRSMLAGIASPVNGQGATLLENGVEYVFEFSTANLSLQVAGDYLGNYVAPTSTTGSAGAWVKQASPDVTAQQNIQRLLDRVEALEDTAKSILPALTTGGASIHAVYSTTRLVPSYAGPAFRGIRNSDSAAMDVAFTGKTVAPGDIAVLRGTGSTLRLDKWYDQSGNGLDMLQATSARRPGVREDVYQNGAPIICIDGGPFIGGPTRGFDFTHALAGQGCTYFVVTDFKASHDKQALLEYTGSAGGGRFLYHEYGGTGSAPNGSCLLEYGGNLFQAWPDKHWRAGTSVYAVRESTGALELFVGGERTVAVWQSDLTTGVAPSTDTLTTGHLGYSGDPANVAYSANMRVLAAIMVQGTLNDTDVQAITRALQSNFGIPSRFDSRVVIIGDSIGEGAENTNTLELIWNLRQQALKGLPQLFNFSVSGKQLSQAYTDRALYDATVYKSGLPMVYVLQVGTNDLQGGATAGGLYTSLTNYVSYLHGLGPNVKVVVNTILKRSDNSTAVAAQVVDYNNLIRANAAGADAWADIAAEPHFAAPGSELDTTILGDGIHPTSLAYTYYAPVEAAAINSVLP